MWIDRETATLICEGDCNPRIGQIDRAIDLARIEQDRRANREHAPLTDTRLTDALGTLTYTFHVEVRPFFYRCLACGHERRFGRSKWESAAGTASTEIAHV